MPSLSNVLAGIPGLGGYEAQNQINREKEQGQLSSMAGLAGLMQQAQKRKMMEQEMAAREKYAQNPAGSMDFLRATNPGALAEIMAKAEMEKTATADYYAGMNQPTQQAPQATMNFPGMTPQQIAAEGQRIADPTERAQFMGNLPQQASPTQLSGITPEKAALMMGSPNKRDQVIGQMAMKHFEKKEAASAALEGRKDIVQMMQGNKTSPKTMAQIQEEEKIKAIGKAEGEAAALNVPGSKANTKLTDSVKKNKAIADTTAIKAKIVTDKVDEALSETGFFSTGLTGEILGLIPGTSAYNLESTLDTIKANIGFNELQAMRQVSPTGGALGQVAVRELDMLQAVIASLKKGQSRDKLENSLNQVAKHYSNWKKAVDQANTQETTGSAPAASDAPSSEDTAALSWANSNPNDPRAAAIKQRLGAR